MRVAVSVFPRTTRLLDPRNYAIRSGTFAAERGRMRTLVAAAAMLLASRLASADCVYHNGYYDPGLRGACAEETSVPEGCPLHVATPVGTLPALQVLRDAEPVELVSSTAVVDTISIPMNRVDPVDCDCASTPSAGAFDRHEVTVTGAVENDVIVFDAGQLETGTAIAIGPAAPCAPPVWPTAFVIATQCDRCPVDEQSPEAGGCATASGDGSVLGFLVLGALLASRRAKPANT